MVLQLVVATGNRTGQIIPVEEEKFIIGRAADCHLKTRSEMVSRYHCAILVGDDTVVRDLGSKNGVRLNGEKISGESKLQDGDKLVVGPLEFYVHFADIPTVDGHVDKHAGWFSQPGSGDIPSELPDTVLLDHLKALNPKANTEPEQPVLDLLKKFL